MANKWIREGSQLFKRPCPASYSPRPNGTPAGTPEYQKQPVSPGPSTTAKRDEDTAECKPVVQKASLASMGEDKPVLQKASLAEDEPVLQKASLAEDKPVLQKASLAGIVDSKPVIEKIPHAKGAAGLDEDISVLESAI